MSLVTEYMYRVLKNHATCTLPEEALYMIRFHSFYPWHKDGEYMHLCSSKDLDMLPWVRLFKLVPDLDRIIHDLDLFLL